MELIVLGSGTSVPHATRGSAGFWLETDGGSLLLDCSASSIHRMAQERLDWANLDAIWISHFHLDHCGGVMPFLFGAKHAAETRERRKPLRIRGPAGLKDLLSAFDSANEYELFDQPFPVEIVEVENLEEFEILPGIGAAACKTLHSEESLALHLRQGDQMSFVYTSDTAYSDVIAAFARNVDFLVTECSFVRDKPAVKHMELAEAMHLIRKAAPKRAMFTHLYPVWDEVDFAAEIGKFDPMCEVIEAVDGLRVVI